MMPARFHGLDFRTLSEDERALLVHVSMYGIEGYPVSKVGRRWHYQFRTVASPRLCKTKRETTASLERFLDLLRTLHAYESWKRTQTSP